MWERTSIKYITTKHFPRSGSWMLHLSPSFFCSYLIACIAGSRSLIALLGGNLVLQPPGGDVTLLFTDYQRKERLRNLEGWRGVGFFTSTSYTSKCVPSYPRAKRIWRVSLKGQAAAASSSHCFLSPLVSMGICVWVATLNPFIAPQGLGLSPETGCEKQHDLKWVERKFIW